MNKVKEAVEVVPEVVSEVKPMFMSRKHIEYMFARFEDNDVVAWRRDMRSGDNHECIGKLTIDMVDSDNLKYIGVWDKLGKEVQDRSLKLDEGGVNEKMEKARGARRRKYTNVPTEVKCSNCGVLQKMQPGQIVKRVEKIAAEKSPVLYLLEDFLKGFVCQKCHKTPRGRKSTGKCKPIELHCCKCKNTVTYPTNVLLKRAEKKNLTLEKLISSFVCQSCSPCHRGRPKKSK